MKYVSAVAIFAVIILSCNNSNNKTEKKTDSSGMAVQLPDTSAFHSTIDDKQVNLYTLKNNNIKVAITNYGARIVSILVPDKSGKLIDVAVGYNKVLPYTEGNDTYFGAIVGRYGNRIAKGKFSLDGKQYTLATNNGVNHLHGGNKGFSRVVWNAKQVNNTSLVLTYLSKNGEEGYPGNLNITVTYTISGSALNIQYNAASDMKTILNLTNHTYFNLNGEGSGTIDGNLLMINADNYTPVDSTLIPTGKIKPVAGTPLDFRTLTPIGARINDSSNEQIKYGKGYDHNFVLNKQTGTTLKAAEVVGNKSGIVMDVYTTQPGIQFYSGNFMDGTHVLNNGTKDAYRTAFCLETQHYPDSPNHSNFPSAVLDAGDAFTSSTSYTFYIQK